MKAEDFLSAQQKDRLVAAIKEAERNTSGEIRIHIDDTCSGNPMKRAGQVFRFLRMDRTARRLPLPSWNLKHAAAPSLDSLPGGSRMLDWSHGGPRCASPLLP